MSKIEFESFIFSKCFWLNSERIECIRSEILPTVYDRVGGDAPIQKLSSSFYERVYNDPSLKTIFASSTKQEAVENQADFLTQLFGGPRRYAERKGKYTRLVSRHGAYQINERHAEQWLAHMRVSIEDVPEFANDDELSCALNDYFTYTAFWIVFGLTNGIVNRGQPTGGTTVDPGRNW
mmetsp:Transcript_6129/g.13089  ORF Transcript_6129/g.13089 Transcript_6129/m.13089 type:complete len:179 (-) Transcript_6129:359-895(-)